MSFIKKALSIQYITTFLLIFLISTSSADSFAVKPIINFDAKLYLGTWYEVARLPFYFEKDCLAPIKAEYASNPEDSDEILVTNSCRKKDGSVSSAKGVASFLGAKNIARLDVTFLPSFFRWLPFTKGDYWVLYTDYNHYALVGSPNHRYLWILSRSEKVSKKEIQFIMKIAKDQGFSVEHLVFNYDIS